MVTYERPRWARRFPEESGASKVLASAISACIGVVTVLLGVSVFKEYSIALFCGVPVVMVIYALTTWAGGEANISQHAVG